MTRRLSSLLGNSQRLDGGAMFGNAPRALWSRWIVPDEQHRIPLQCRCLLVREDERTLLFEAGIGVFFEPMLRERFGVQESEHVLLDSLAAEGVAPEDIDVVVLSHLHFDHAGGLLSAWDPSQPPRLVFPRAHYVVGRRAFERACAPHARDRASFIPELPGLLQDTGRLELTEGDRSEVLGEGYRLHYSDGHTPGLILAEIETAGDPVLFAADLIPGRPWVHLPITMGYDRYPEQLIDEKRTLLSELHERGARLFYTHDPDVAMSAIALDERGRFSATDEHATLRGWTGQ